MFDRVLNTHLHLCLFDSQPKIVDEDSLFVESCLKKQSSTED